MFYMCPDVKTAAVIELCSLEHRGLEDRPVLRSTCRPSIFFADSGQQYLCVAQLPVAAGQIRKALQTKGNQPADTGNNFFMMTVR